MSLRASPRAPIPAETVRVARAAFPKGTLCMQRRDTLGPIYHDAQFATLFSQTGQPAAAPARLVLVLVLQCAEGLSDRQAADAVRGRIDWKYALALELTDPGFDASVLSEFRTRLMHGAADSLLLETLLTRLRERALLNARGTQRTDSTHSLAALRVHNRLELVGETMRDALNRLAVVAPTWLRAPMPPAWLERYGSRVEHDRFPTVDAERQPLAAPIGADGFALLQTAYAPDAPPAVRAAGAVAVRRQIWVQHDDGPDTSPRWRHEPDGPPSAQLIHSPDALEARYSMQHGSAWVGSKAHATATCDAATPPMITHGETTPATMPDDHRLETIHAALAEQALLPRQPRVDCGYTAAETLIASARDDAVTIVGPVAVDPSWQAREGTGSAHGAFTIHWETPTATCPHGTQRRQWQPDQEVIQIRFANKDCQACTARPACTRAHTAPRTRIVRTQAYHEALQATRQHQRPKSVRSPLRTAPALQARSPRGYAPSAYADHATLAWPKRICSTS